MQLPEFIDDKITYLLEHTEGSRKKDLQVFQVKMF